MAKKSTLDHPSREDFQREGRNVVKEFQNKLNEKAGGDVLKRVALRFVQGLDAKETRLAADKGRFKDERHLTDHKMRLAFGKIIVEVFGAKETEKVEHEHGGEIRVLKVKFSESDCIEKNPE